MSDAEIILTWSQDVDLGNINKIRRDIDSALAQDSPRKLVIDLGAVDFIDSTGLGTLVYAMNESRKRHVQFAIRRVSPRTARLLALTKLTSVFTIQDQDDF